ncbi:MAG: pyrroline-5-carboxylate reductase [Firmicutes bacterium]|nr:pyrroline-5-carboxylate reductase [Bacillota bacterium]
MKYAFIGLGNMAGAIIQGMAAAGVAKGADIGGYDIDPAQGQRLQESCGITLCDGLAQAAQAKTLVLSVKPQVLPALLPQLAPVLPPETLVVSIAAGKDLAFLQKALGENRPIVRVMPNINAKAAAATSCYTPNDRVSPEQEETVRQIFSSIGSITKLEEKLFSVFTALCGSAPAFTYMYIDALAQAAVAAGMPRQMAQALAADCVCGSAKMVLTSGQHPAALTDQVCSPGGVTIAGVLQLDKAGFVSAVHQGMAAMIDKDKQLAQ